MGHMGNEVYRGYGIQEVWGTWTIRYMDNRDTRGMWYRGYGVQRVWVTWPIGPMGNGTQGAMGYRAYRPHG